MCRGSGKKLNLNSDWLNNDFKRTESYTPKLFQYSVFYRDFLDVLSVRLVTREYLIAMKLKSYRSYKNDLSDVIGILIEEYSASPIKLKDIKLAVSNLYGNYDKALKKEARVFIENVIDMNLRDLKTLYKDTVEQEKNRREKLLKIEKYSSGKLTEKNLNETIKKIDEHKPIKDILKLLDRENSVSEDPEVSDDDSEPDL